jgi:hypothetical protein
MLSDSDMGQSVERRPVVLVNHCPIVGFSKRRVETSLSTIGKHIGLTIWVCALICLITPHPECHATKAIDS